MHKRFNPIREHLRKTYSVPGDVLDAIMADTLEMAKDLPRMKLIATIKQSVPNVLGETFSFFEPVEYLDPEEFTDSENLMLIDEEVIGTLKITRDEKGNIRKIEPDMVEELNAFEKDTEIFVMR